MHNYLLSALSKSIAYSLTIGLLVILPASAQDLRYISDDVFVVLHAGPGSNYRWMGKLIPGTQLTEMRRSTDGNWAEVSTERGTLGWVQSEYLASEPPAQVRLPAVVRQLEDAERTSAELRGSVAELEARSAELSTQLQESQLQLQQVSDELAQLRQVSGSAIETADSNRRLEEQASTLQMHLDTLEADNLRLQDRVRSSAFIDGALAVVFGVVIALVVPRLWPKRKSSSSWA